MSTEVNSYKLTPEEIEKLLSSEYGKKIAPVDSAKLAKHKQRRQKTHLFGK